MPQPQMARAPLWADATFHTTSTAEQRAFSINKPFFVSPTPAGRKITAGFSWMQRIGKTASMDVWFPDVLRKELDLILASGGKLGSHNFPAEWAAVRQFELLQEAGNYKVYDLNAGYLSRTLVDLMRSMRAGGYRVTVATIGSYDEDESDDLKILDQRLQDRLSRLTHMLYMEVQSDSINTAVDRVLAEERWHFQSALPHVGLTLGARDLFAANNPDAYTTQAGRKHKLAEQFFEMLSFLPQSHIVHDTAVGLQLPESINEHEWLYLAEGTETFAAFNQFLSDIFTPFNRVSLSRLHGREGAGAEMKPSAQHMRGYGDHMRESTSGFYKDAVSSLYALQ